MTSLQTIIPNRSQIFKNFWSEAHKYLLNFGKTNFFRLFVIYENLFLLIKIVLIVRYIVNGTMSEVLLLRLYETRAHIFLSKKLPLKTTHKKTYEKFNFNEIYSTSKLSGEYRSTIYIISWINIVIIFLFIFHFH